MKSVKATIFNVNVVTYKMNESIGNKIGGATDLLDMFIDFKVL